MNLFPLVVVGMPAMAGKVVVMDPKPMDAMLLGTGPPNQLHTHLYAPGTAYNPSPYPAGPGIPVTDRHVQMTMVDVSRFTQTVPPPGDNPPVTGPESAMLENNPFIGTNPLAAPFDADVPAGSTPGVTVSLGGLSATGSFLFDTGAAVSFISQQLAGSLNVRYRSGTYPSSAPILEQFDPAQPEVQGTALPNQFTQDITGIGGAVTIAGFRLDSLLLRAVEGDASNPTDPNHLRYLDAPVFVLVLR